MSADNWTYCPRCTRLREEKLKQLEDDFAVAYGKLSLQEYEAMREKVRKAQAEDGVTTLREDWEIYGAEDGLVEVSYRCSCTACNLSHTFTYSSGIPK